MSCCNNIPLSYSFHEVNKMFYNCVKNEVEMLGINPTYRFIFMALCNKEEGINQSEICEVVHLKAPTISLTLQQMENEELITRSKSKVDSRQTIVRLTEKGHKLDQKLKDIFKKWEIIMVSSLNEDELSTLKSCLLKIKNSLNGGENNV